MKSILKGAIIELMDFINIFFIYIFIIEYKTENYKL